MRVKVHLIAPPWVRPEYSNLSIGSLKAFLDQRYAEKVETVCYSAFLTILGELKGIYSKAFYEIARVRGEELYAAIYWNRFLRQERRLDQEGEARLWAHLSRTLPAVAEQFSFGASLPLASGDREAAALEQATRSYVDQVILPQLDPGALNIIGLSQAFVQVMSSFYIARHIDEAAPPVHRLTVYGGSQATQPHIVELAQKLGIEGYAVRGEGELKLAAIIDELLARDEFDGRLLSPPAGVFFYSDIKEPHAIPDTPPSLEVESVQSLPLADHHEYFEAFDELVAKEPLLGRVLQPKISISGGRGCFGRCDFCSQASQWSRLRQLDGKAVYDLAVAARARYGSRPIMFSDWLCDTWVEDYCAEAQKRGPIPAYGFFRSSHDQEFWDKMIAAGFTGVFVGFEAFSDRLLKVMKKGVTAAHNLLTYKYLAECGLTGDFAIITHHPRSTLEDIAETRRIFDAVPYLPGSCSEFWTGPGSPLYSALTLEQRKRLRPMYETHYPELSDLILDRGFASPDLRAPAEVVEAWNAFVRAYKSRPLKTIQVETRPDGSLVIRKETPRKKRIVLKGEEARLYSLCHAGPTTRELLEKGFSLEFLKKTLAGFESEGIGLTVSGRIIAVALRDRSVSAQA